MGLSKIVRKASNKLAPAIQVANKVAQNSPQILDKTSNVLAKTGNVLSKVGDASGKLLENPATMAFIASNPELAPVYAGAVSASALTSSAGKLATKGSGIASSTSNIIEKAQNRGSQPAMTFA